VEEAELPDDDLIVHFQEELERIDGEFVRSTATELPQQILDFLTSIEADRILAMGDQSKELIAIADHLRSAGIQIIEPEIPRSKDGNTRYEALEGLDEVPVGLTPCVAGFADTGTVVLPSGEGSPGLTSLLPQTHIVLLRTEDIYPTLGHWISAGGRETIASSPQLTFISGPSRTADVEMILTLGVHGPGRLVVFTRD